MQFAHRHICDMVATFLDIETNDVMEYIIDSALSSKYLDAFLAADGTHACMFLYQDGPPFEIGYYIICRL